MQDSMTSIKKRILLAAQEADITVAAEELTRLAGSLNRYQEWLPSSIWPTQASKASWQFADQGSKNAANSTRLVGESIIHTVEEALARAKLALSGGAFTLIDDEGALRSAQQLVESERYGPLAGLTFAVKDMIAVVGHPMRAGSAVRDRAAVEPADAAIVKALRNMGAILIGATSMHEFAFGVTGINNYAGTPLNPHDKTRIAGGSSSGSAVAVAEGSARIALGTDTGGSVRIPAALCGIVGFKPCYKAYPMTGVLPLSPTLDHLGLFARSVSDIARVHTALGFTVGKDKRPTHLGFIPAQLESSSPGVQRRIGSVLDHLSNSGSRITEVEWPSSDEIVAVSTIIMCAEAAAVHYSSFLNNAVSYGVDVRHRLLQGLSISGWLYASALERRRRLKQVIRASIAEVDCVMGPTVGFVAPTLSEAQNREISSRIVQFTRVANLVGLPALSLPVPGPGLPVGLHIMARNDDDTIRIGAFVEQLLAGS